MHLCLCSKEILQQLCSAFSARYHSLQHGNWWFTLRQHTWSTFTSWELDPRVPDLLPALRKVQTNIRRNHRRHRKIFKWVSDILQRYCFIKNRTNVFVLFHFVLSKKKLHLTTWEYNNIYENWDKFSFLASDTINIEHIIYCQNKNAQRQSNCEIAKCTSKNFLFVFNNENNNKKKTHHSTAIFEE